MTKKPLKPPYYRLTAICNRHGMVTVNRKPNPKAGQPDPHGSGRLITKYPANVVCPHCPWHCPVVTGELVTKDAETVPK